MPGRRTPPMPDRLSPQWAISALTSVPVAVAGGGMHDQARRLVDDDDLVVLVDDVERDVSRLRVAPAPAAGPSTVIASPALTRWPGSRIVRPPIATWPARISALRRERDRLGDAGGEHAVEPLAGLASGDQHRLAVSIAVLEP